MAVVLKFVTMFSQEAGYGWSEVHYQNSSSNNPNLRDLLNVFIANIGTKRALMLAGDCHIEGFRVSYPKGNTIASFSLATRLPGDTAYFGAAPSLSLAVALYDVTYTKSKIVHIRGFWDVVEVSGVYTPATPDGAQFALRLAQWKDALILGNYGWPSKDPAQSAVGVVNTYTTNNDQIVAFVLANPGMPVGSVGTQQQVRFSRLNNSKSVLNRSLLCNVVSQTSLTTVAPIAAGPSTSGGKFNFRAPSFTAYFFLGNVTLGERRMGKPSGRYPGRSKARQRV